MKVGSVLLCGVTLLALLFGGVLHSQEDAEILDIRHQFSLWQQELKAEVAPSQQLRRIYYGDSLEYDKWVLEGDSTEGGFTAEEVSIYRDDSLGTLLKMAEGSPSGDWYIASEHYYWPSQQLYFVFWKLSTFQAEKPVTVERRIYFDSDGRVLRQLESIHEMGSNDRIENISYSNQYTRYWLAIDALPFRYLLETE